MSTTPQKNKKREASPALPPKRAPVVGWLVPHMGPIQMQRDVITDDYEECDFLMVYDAWRRDELGPLASDEYNVLDLDDGWCVAFDPREGLPPNESMLPFLGEMCAIASGPVAIFRRSEEEHSSDVIIRPLPAISTLDCCSSFCEALMHYSRKLH